MCLQHKFDPWKPISKFYYELRLLTRHHQNTTEMKTALLNQLHALEYSGYSSKEVEKQIKKVVALLDKQLIEGKNEIDAHIKKDKEVEYNNNQLTYLRKRYTELKVAKADSEELGMDTSDIDTEISELKAKVVSTQAKLKGLV